MKVNNTPTKITSVEMKSNQKVTLSIKTKIASGVDAPLASPPVWTTSDNELVTLHPSGDYMNCEVRGTGQVGTCNVTCQGEGSTGQIAAVTNFTITSPYADIIEIIQGPTTQI